MADTAATVFARNLSRVMQEGGRTISDLADEMGVTDAAAQAWTTGRAMPRASKIPDLCVWLGCSADDLLIDYDGLTRVRASREEIDVLMAYRRTSDTRRQVVREILRTGGKA